MQSYGKEIFDRIVDKQNIRLGIINAAKGKRNRRDVERVLKNIDKHVDKIYEILITGNYQPIMTKARIIHENDSRHKTRKIRKPRFIYDQIIHHTIIQILKPLIVKRLIYHAYGSVPDRGLHRASKFIKKWIKNPKMSKYCLKMDIHHFYESVDKNILKQKITKMFRDKRLTSILYKIIDSFEETGIPLGLYTSQWFVLIYISDLDHYIKEELKQKYYVRYMDDMVILGSNKKELHKIREKISNYLKSNLNLRLKSNWQVFPISYTSKKDKKEHGRPLDFLGFLLYHDKTIIRKHDLLALTRKATKVSKKSIQRATENDCLSILSRMGTLKHTNTYKMANKYIYSKLSINDLKKKVSILKRRELGQVIDKNKNKNLFSKEIKIKFTSKKNKSKI